MTDPRALARPPPSSPPSLTRPPPGALRASLRPRADGLPPRPRVARPVPRRRSRAARCIGGCAIINLVLLALLVIVSVAVTAPTRPHPRRRHIPVLRRPRARLHVSRRRRRGRTRCSEIGAAALREGGYAGTPPSPPRSAWASSALQRHRRRRLRGRPPANGTSRRSNSARRRPPRRPEHVRGLSRRAAEAARRRGAPGDSRFTPGVGATRHAPVVASQCPAATLAEGFPWVPNSRAIAQARRSLVTRRRRRRFFVGRRSPFASGHVCQPRARANASRHRDRRCRRASNGSPAEALARDVREAGGVMTADDLARYRPAGLGAHRLTRSIRHPRDASDLERRRGGGAGDGIHVGIRQAAGSFGRARRASHAEAFKHASRRG